MEKVVKFGEGSLASARQFKKVTDIIESDKSRRYVAPSAPGRRNDRDEKVADLLYACYDVAVEGRSYRRILKEIKSKYMDIISDLDLSLNLNHEFNRVEENFLAKAGWDCAASRGEYLNGIVITSFLGLEFMGTMEVILFDENGNFEPGHTNREPSERLGRVGKAVIPDSYGSEPDGTTRTFPRGGSDITGSIVAKIIYASMYESWTDVSGVLVAGPRIVENPEVIETITYKELRKLSYMGASVLHKDATFPVYKRGIPISIRNTNYPEGKGAFIVESTRRRPRYTITGIAGKKGFCSINTEKTMMSVEVGFGREVPSVFKQCGISFEHMPSGVNTMAVYVHQSKFEGFEQSVIVGIHRAVEPDIVELESDLAPIAVVGRGVRSTRETTGRIFFALVHVRVNMKMIDQGSGEWSIIIGVENNDFETVTRAIYGTFVITEL